MMDLDQLQQTHSGYREHAEQSNFHYRSYIGGELYKRGEYLTRYIGEENGPGDQYTKRLHSTPLDNQVATTIDIYRSMLFKNVPQRTLGLLNNNPLVDDWMKDTDQEGQSMNSFMKTANDLAMVMGNVWVLVTNRHTLWKQQHKNKRWAYVPILLCTHLQMYWTMFMSVM